MKFKKIGNKVFGRIELGKDIVKELEDFCRLTGIKCGTISGIGAVDKVTIGLFDSKSKEYISTSLEGDYEVTSLTGNISSMNEEPYLHMHINLSDHKFRTFGGHLNYARVSATCEVVIEVIDGELSRFKDDETELNLLKL